MAGKKTTGQGPTDHPRNLMRKQYTLDVDAVEGLKTIQAEVPEVESDSAAIRYAIRRTVEMLRKRKPRA